MMKTKILFACCFLSVHLLTAQFSGGNGDGQDRAQAHQINLLGQPQGTDGLYYGGDGDGHDQEAFSAWLAGPSVAGLYNGGWGDGHDQSMAQLYLNGTDLSQLYQGGSGDGHDQMRIQAFFDNTNASLIYAGGDGDGHDYSSMQVYLNGVPTAVYFAGGDGDGHDHAQTQTAMNGDMLSVLFGGGDGDGHDVSQYNGVVPFPVVLLTFDAFPEEEFVLVQWVTEREENSAYFTVEKTQDGNLFLHVDEVEAAGFSEVIRPYETVDKNPISGQSFYRLKMTDLDGAFSYSQLVEVNYSNNVRWDFTLYPNPNQGQRLNIDLRGLVAGDHFAVTMADMQGQIVYQAEVHATYGGGLTHQIELDRPLAKGSYVVQVMSAEKGQMAKFLLVR